MEAEVVGIGGIAMTIMAVIEVAIGDLLRRITGGVDAMIDLDLDHIHLVSTSKINCKKYLKKKKKNRLTHSQD